MLERRAPNASSSTATVRESGNMATFANLRSNGAEVGKYEIDPAAIGPADQQAIAARRRGHVREQSAPGLGQDQDPLGSGGYDEEDVSAKGDGQRPGRLAAQRRSPRRRPHARPAAPRLVLSAAEEGPAVATRMAVACGWPTTK